MFGLGPIELVILLGGVGIVAILVFALTKRARGQTIICPHCGKEMRI